MKLQEAKQKAEMMLDYLKPYVKRAEIVGSIRRECLEVKDIDIILEPNDMFETFIYEFRSNVEKKGKKIITLELNGTQYDLYICTEENWEVSKLIRTGSKEHNKKLCRLAIEKGLHLKAGGEGLMDIDGNVVSNTERGILTFLLNKYVEPKDRK